ncbi:WXG100 family type VII secretion target [Nocardia puris]|uniref:ESAT-6-like protein n=1 Tax=Nocardia puris TaxID=208602 RepID=A0A366CTH9_9NOCA|nr:WXG100 family type VII secretion target [Nocardia puris]RBO79615.1 WXG100 family type VII secretion target [Nocardia puris]
MTNPFTVNLAELDEITQKIRAFDGFITDSLAGLEQRIAAMHQNWTGEAATKHAQAHREWMQGATEVREGIATVCDIARQAHENYTETLTSNLRMLGRE